MTRSVVLYTVLWVLTPAVLMVMRIILMLGMAMWYLCNRPGVRRQCAHLFHQDETDTTFVQLCATCCAQSTTQQVAT